MRRMFVLVSLLASLALAAPARAAAVVGVGAGVWIRPVAGAVVRAFDPPRTTYGPGHRGVDFAAPPGTPVAAAGDGVVVFAGWIGPSAHVVVLHSPSGWRTGYSFLESVVVHTGEQLHRGSVVGTSGGVEAGSQPSGHDGSVLHFSLRIGDAYVDPMILFHPLDLGAVVHLAPTDSPPNVVGRSGPGRVRLGPRPDVVRPWRRSVRSRFV